MNKSDKNAKSKRSFGRRKEDLLLRNKNQRYKQLHIVGQTITSEMNMDALFQLIMDQTNQIMNTERSTIFLYDEKTDELWSLVATRMEKNEIRIQADSGIAGQVFKNREQLIINDAYIDSRFNLEVDQQSGFRTKNILCVPVINREGKCIGVLEALNNHSGKFTREDGEFLRSISNYVAIAVENSKLYEDIKSYSEKLKATIIQNENLEKVKGRLTKFVPASVARLIEQDPDKLNGEKIPMEVSILFIDIQEFSKITEGYDQRLVNDMVESHFSKYLECIHRHGGELNETSGDGLMVIFKSDSIEYHAYEAVAAGLKIVRENSRLNEQLSYPWGRIDLHMGINSGKAYVGATRMKSITGERWTYTASGMVTVLAARIGALSEKTRLYIGSETHKFIQAHCDCDFIGSRKLKNVSKAMPIYWVKNIRG